MPRGPTPARKEGPIYLVSNTVFNRGRGLYEPYDLMDEYEYYLSDYKDEDELIEDIIRRWKGVEIYEDDLPSMADGVVSQDIYSRLYGRMETVALFIPRDIFEEKNCMTEEEWNDLDPENIHLYMIMKTIDKEPEVKEEEGEEEEGEEEDEWEEGEDEWEEEEDEEEEDEWEEEEEEED